jgi:hypothetical protein
VALTIATDFSANLGGGALLKVYTVTFDASYPTGGETMDISADFSGSPSVIPSGPSDAGEGYFVGHDQGTAAAGILIAFESGADGTANDEVTNATDLSGLIIKCIAIGNGAV